MKAKTTFSLKDQLFNREKVTFLATQFANAWEDFPKDDFIESVMVQFPQLELKQRIVHITHCLRASLPEAYQDGCDIILRALPPVLDPTQTDDDFGDFIIAPLGHFVALYGCSAENLTYSLSALREITMRFSAEDAIRYFINAFPTQTLAFLTQCAQSDNYHVRRLASEGTRPKLPWSQKLLINHQQPMPILDALFADSTRYVTRSVANHLNDIAKIEPALVISTLSRWQQSGEQTEKEMAFIIKHSTRTLVKKGNQAALALLGFGEKPAITIADFEVSTPVVKVGEALHFSFIIKPHKAQNLLIDYEMQFAGADKPGGKKVFKLKSVKTIVGKVVKIRKKHPLRLMTTRRLYQGTHTITLLVNGQPYQTKSFELVVG